MIEQMNSDRESEIDGGVYEATAPTTVAAGANVLESLPEPVAQVVQ
jgi:pentose-5-phosphate-3-epimerase